MQTIGPPLTPSSHVHDAKSCGIDRSGMQETVVEAVRCNMPSPPTFSLSFYHTSENTLQSSTSLRSIRRHQPAAPRAISRPTMDTPTCTFPVWAETSVWFGNETRHQDRDGWSCFELGSRLWREECSYSTTSSHLTAG